jgi:sugar phosphate isomerase/epimerase
MTKITIGIQLSSLRLPLREGLEEARRLGVTGVELHAVGDLSPNRLSQTGRRELRHLLRGFGLEVTALNCPLRHGFDTPENLQPRIEHVQKVMALSYDLGPRIVIVQAGKAPESIDDPRGGLLSESLRALAQHGDRVGATLAVETGLEAGEALAVFLGRFDTGGLGVNYDPANLLMNGFEPVAAARALAGRIVHAHAKDARRAGASRTAQEVALGHGDLDWMTLLGTFEEIDYRGWLTIVREGGSQPARDVAAGVRFLRRLVA